MEIKDFNKEDKRLSKYPIVRGIITENGWDIYSYKNMEQYKESIKDSKDGKYQLKTLIKAENAIDIWYSDFALSVIDIEGILYIELNDLDISGTEEVGERTSNKGIKELQDFMINKARRKTILYNPNTKEEVETIKASAEQLLKETKYLIFANGRNWMNIPLSIEELVEYKKEIENVIRTKN